MPPAINTALRRAAATLSPRAGTPVREGARRDSRAASRALACGGCLALGGAMTLADLDDWMSAAILGGLALAVLAVSLWVARASCSRSEHDGGDDGTGGGGGGVPRRPGPPAPLEPLGGPSMDWSEFDALRCAWAHDAIEPVTSPREPIGA